MGGGGTYRFTVLVSSHSGILTLTLEGANPNSQNPRNCSSSVISTATPLSKKTDLLIIRRCIWGRCKGICLGKFGGHV